MSRQSIRQYERNGSTITLKYEEDEDLIGYRHHWNVKLPSGEEYDKPSFRSARALTAICAAFDNIDPNKSIEGHIPIEIAVNGKPAIATHLIGIYNMKKGQVADLLEVEEDTIAQYIRRFEKNI